MRYIIAIFLISCSSVPVDKSMERFVMLDKSFPNVEMCIMDHPENTMHCRKVTSGDRLSKPLIESDTYLMISQKDFLEVRRYLYKRFKEERNGKHF